MARAATARLPTFWTEADVCADLSVCSRTLRGMVADSVTAGIAVPRVPAGRGVPSRWFADEVAEWAEAVWAHRTGGQPAPYTPPPLPPPGDTFVYFIQSRHGGPVKIGHSTTPATRLSDLQIGHADELVLLLAVPASVDDERSLHARFAADRLRGEWFRLSPRLRGLIRTWTQQIREEGHHG